VLASDTDSAFEAAAFAFLYLSMVALTLQSTNNSGNCLKASVGLVGSMPEI